MEWKTVYVFVSSTFNDMHAERDLLVKRVFPELRLWCARRKLQLRDIDLRWGVSAADAQENKRVVEVCLRNIDKCRPFFLCFIGQRRGWVPRKDDINPETLAAFPELCRHIGSASVTEMEVLHALLQPMAPNVAPVRHARFYFRDESYTKSLQNEAHKNLFIPGRGFFHTADKGVDAFKKRLPRQYPAVSYTARWNPDLPSPELTGELSKGRLEDFRTGNSTLEADVLEWLKESIQQEYPDHQELSPAASELDRELDRQDTQRFQCGDGYIPRPAEEQALARSLEAAGGRPLVLLAKAGCGKTSLLAAFLQTQQHIPVYYRFVGTTPQSFRLEDLSASLTEQWVRDGLLPENVLQYTPGERKLIFPTLCVQAAEKKPFLLVLDGMDQLLGSENWQTWLPKEMPNGTSVLVSLRDTDAELPDYMAIHRLGLMTDPKDKAQMASAYLSSFLKNIDQDQMAQLLAMEGSDNPLYMKIVLNELRQHGSFDTLMELFRRDYGSTPLSAFTQVLNRIQRELKDTFFDDGGAMLLFFGCLAYARQGLDGQFFLWACRNLAGWEENVISERQVLDLVYGLARELEPFMVLDGDRIALRYDSFRQAIRQGYSELLEQYANILLAQAFLLRLGNSLEPEDARTTLLHVADTTDDYTHEFFRHPARMTLLIRCGGAEMVAKACDVLVQKRNLSEYADLAKVLRRAAPRLDTNPNTLFMELERFGDHNNPVTRALMSGGKDYDTGVILRPRYPANAATALCWEYAHQASSAGCEVWAVPYFVSISDQVLKVTDLRSQETVHVMRLSQQYRGAVIRLAAEKDTLFLCRFTEDYSQVRICDYKLPDMLPVEQPVTMDCPHGNPWCLHAYGGKIYALQYRRTGGTAGGEYTVSCLSTGTILFQTETGDNLQYNLCGGWFVYREAGSGDCRVLSLKDGTCLFEDRFLGTDHLDPELERRLSPYGKLFANTANLQAAAADKLYIWQSGSRIKPDGGIELLQRMHRLVPTEEGLSLERTWNEQVAHHSAFAVLGNRYLITESQGYVHIMDSDCRLLGKMNLGEAIQHGHQANTLFALFDGQILMFHKDKIRSYDAEQLVSSLEQDLEEAYVGRRSSAIIDDSLYVMELEMERIDLHTMETARELRTEKQYWERYDPWNMLGQNLWIGYGVKSGFFTIKRPGSMERIGCFQMPDADCRELRHAFLYRDRQNVVHVGLLESDLTKAKRPLRDEKQDFAKLWLRTKPLLKLPYDTPWTEIDLNTEFAAFGLGLGPTSVTAMEKPYLILPNVYKDQWTIQLRVYDLQDHTTIYSKDVDLRTGGYFSSDNFHMCPGNVMYGYGRQEDGKLEILDLTVPKVFVMNRWLKILTQDPLAKQVCLYDRNSRELLVYDTAAHDLVRITTLDEDFRPHQAVLLKRHVILTQQFRDTVRIYDRGTGELLCNQRLEVGLDEPMVHEATSTIAMVDSNCRKYFWTLEEHGKQHP